MPKLSIYTFGILHEPYGSPDSQPFVDANPDTFAAADSMPGFIGRASKPDPAKPSFGQDYGPWGVYAFPRFYDGGMTPGTITIAATLSTWTGMAAVHSYAYGGLHRSALGQRANWFRKGDWPVYVLWWVADDAVPTWQEACRKLEKVHDEGPSPAAFNFHTPFNSDGRSTRLGKEIAR